MMKRKKTVLLGIAAVTLSACFCAVAILGFGFRGPRTEPIDPWIVAAEALGTQNIISTNYLNVRLFDTIIEVLVFAIAALGVRYYLTARGRRREADAIPESRVVRVAADVLLPPIVLLGIYIVLHGHLSPGGGFAGGVIAGTGLLLAAIALCTETVRSRISSSVLEWVEWAVLCGIIVLAVVPVTLSRPALANPIGPGTMGRLLSGGTTLLYSMLIGVKVFVGSWVIVRRFIDHRGEI